MDVVLRLIPFFLLIGCGAVLAGTKRVDLTGARALSAYVFWLAFPALLIRNLSAMTFPDGRTVFSLAVFCLTLLALAGAVAVIGRLLGWRPEARLGAGVASMASNIPFLAAPFALSVFGPSSAGAVSGVMAADGLVIVSTVATLLRVAAGRSPAKAALSSLGNPLVAAAAIGVAMSYVHWQASGPLGQAIGLLAATASPVGLTALGVVVALEFGKPDKADAAPLLTALLAKLVLSPALVWLALGVAHADPLLRAVATLMAASPTAVHVFIQTRTLNVFTRGGALAVVVSSLIALVSLSLWGELVLRSLR